MILNEITTTGKKDLMVSNIFVFRIITIKKTKLAKTPEGKHDNWGVKADKLIIKTNALIMITLFLEASEFVYFNWG